MYLDKEEKQKKSNELLEMTHGNKIRNFFPWKLYFADIFRELDADSAKSEDIHSIEEQPSGEITE